MFNLSPKDDRFYDMFNEAVSNVTSGAVVMRKTLDSIEDKDINAKEVDMLEHKGDTIVHNVITELNNTFVTPIDREDIYNIIKAIDDVIDCIDSMMHRFIMFDINSIPKEAKVLGDMVVEICKEVQLLFAELKNMRKSKIIMEKVISINKIENDGDSYFRQTICNLFKENENDIIKIIKWREIYQIFEYTLDACEKLANMIEGVVMKYA